MLLKMIATAKRLIENNGVAGVIRIFASKLSWYGLLGIGRLVELRGNVVWIDSCSFYVGNSLIPATLKGLLILDRYEKPERTAVQLFVDPGMPVIELGGSIGVVACITNRLLADPAKHIVVEPNAALIPLLEENRRRNDCGFTILPYAYAYGSDEVMFASHRNFLTSTTVQKSDHSVPVKATNLQSILEENGIERFTLICDIEGSEVQLLEHEGALIGKRAATIIIEMHQKLYGLQRRCELLTKIENLGFCSAWSQSETYGFKACALGRDAMVSVPPAT